MRCSIRWRTRREQWAHSGRQLHFPRTLEVTSVAADTAPPALVEFDFTPKSVDVTTGSRTVEVTARVTDATGAEPLYSLSSSQATSQQAGFGQMTLSSGTAQDGVYYEDGDDPAGRAPAIGMRCSIRWRTRLGTAGSFGPPSGFPEVLQVIVDTARPTDDDRLGPSAPTNDTTPTFAFSSSESGSSFECRVDSGGFAACDSPTTTDALPEGGHTLRGPRNRLALATATRPQRAAASRSTRPAADESRLGTV